jgi:hypothetical protein
VAKARDVDKNIFQFSSRSDFNKDYDLKVKSEEQAVL